MTGWDLLSELAGLADKDCDALNHEIYLGVITKSRSYYGTLENFKIVSTDNVSTISTIFLTTKENTKC